MPLKTNVKVAVMTIVNVKHAGVVISDICKVYTFITLSHVNYIVYMTIVTKDVVKTLFLANT